MKNLITIGFSLIFIIIVSCKEESLNNSDESGNVQKEKINGFVQKGPFINGTSITISELDVDLTPTGKNFNTQILIIR